jgi:hypothetical protein
MRLHSWYIPVKKVKSKKPFWLVGFRTAFVFISVVEDCSVNLLRCFLPVTRMTHQVLHHTAAHHIHHASHCWSEGVNGGMVKHQK